MTIFYDHFMTLLDIGGGSTQDTMIRIHAEMITWRRLNLRHFLSEDILFSCLTLRSLPNDLRQFVVVDVLKSYRNGELEPEGDRMVVYEYVVELIRNRQESTQGFHDKNTMRSKSPSTASSDGSGNRARTIPSLQKAFFMKMDEHSNMKQFKEYSMVDASKLFANSTIVSRKDKKASSIVLGHDPKPTLVVYTATTNPCSDCSNDDPSKHHKPKCHVKMCPNCGKYGHGKMICAHEASK